MRLGRFGRTGDDGRKALAERLKADVRRLLALPDAAAVAVNEILCADPSCPGTETVILVMNPGEKTRAYKVQAAMAEVTDGLLAEALAVRDPSSRTSGEAAPIRDPSSGAALSDGSGVEPG